MIHGKNTEDYICYLIEHFCWQAQKGKHFILLVLHLHFLHNAFFAVRTDLDNVIHVNVIFQCLPLRY